MIVFLASISSLTVIFFGLFLLIKRKVVSLYRGVFFILISALYFTLFFYLGYRMPDIFK
jgi:hypothetical protein